MSILTSLESDSGDHLHLVGTEDGKFVPIAGFDFGSLDGSEDSEPMVSLDQVVSAFSGILAWLQESENFTSAGAKAAALLILLDPTRSRHRSLSEVAAAAGLSRASLSKLILALRDRYGIRLSLRGSLIRQNCREGQLSALADGRHSSVYRKKNATDVKTGDPSMTQGEVSERFETLDSACDEIKALNDQLDAAHEAILATATPRPAPP